MSTLTRSEPLLALALAAGVAACSDTVTVPAQTTLVAAATAEIDPDSVTVGDSLVLELAGNLEGEEGVLLAKGTPIHGAVTAVQDARGQWPKAVSLHVGAVEVGGARHALSARISEVQTDRREREDGDEQRLGTGLVGTVATGRAGAGLVRSEVQQAEGEPVVLGTGALRGYVPVGGRIHLVLAASLEVPPPGEGG